MSRTSTRWTLPDWIDSMLCRRFDTGNSFHRLLPEITHVFRVPEKRPSATVSLLFTALSMLPCLIFVVVLIKFFPLQSSVLPQGKDGE